MPPFMGGGEMIEVRTIMLVNGTPKTLCPCQHHGAPVAGAWAQPHGFNIGLDLRRRAQPQRS